MYKKGSANFQKQILPFKMAPEIFENKNFLVRAAEIFPIFWNRTPEQQKWEGFKNGNKVLSHSILDS